MNLWVIGDDIERAFDNVVHLTAISKKIRKNWGNCSLVEYSYGKKKLAQEYIVPKWNSIYFMLISTLGYKAF